MRLTSTIVLGLLLFGCATQSSYTPTPSSSPVTFNAGGLGYPEEFFVKQLDNLKSQAAFDLGCDGDSLTFEQLRVDSLSPMGVHGCGKKATYIWGSGVGWVMNAETSES